MKARIVLALCAATLMVASQASASVISASSQTARSKPADQVDYLDVTNIQNDLNASLRAAAGASAPAALAPRSAPSTTFNGFLLGTSSNDVGYDPSEYLFDPDSEKQPEGMSLDAMGPGDVLAAGARGGPPGGGPPGGGPPGGGPPGGGPPGGGPPGGGPPGGGVHAAPEPSTWLLLGTGLAMIGAYMMLRRRNAIEAR
jgi:hypothetical protein